jgi:hypothetical protein
MAKRGRDERERGISLVWERDRVRDMRVGCG